MGQICIADISIPAVQESFVVKTEPAIEAPMFPTIAEIRDMISVKIREDIIRFRTCCADPRASK